MSDTTRALPEVKHGAVPAARLCCEDGARGAGVFVDGGMTSVI